MPYVLLILLLASATCFGHGAECDSVVNALIAIPKESLTVTDNEDNLQLPYVYDKSKTLYLNTADKTVKLTNNKEEVFAEGRYTQPNPADNKIYPIGYWRHYYSNGKVKCEGAYILTPYTWVDTTIVKDPLTGKEQMLTKKAIYYTCIQTGDWQYYSTDGKLTTTEHFD